MNIRKITGAVSVSPQIEASDVAAIKNAGFRAVICNRPDGEEADQPGYAEIAAAAEAAGIEARYVPVQSGMVTDGDVAAFGDALSEMQGPVLAYCRTGTRSARRARRSPPAPWGYWRCRPPRPLRPPARTGVCFEEPRAGIALHRPRRAGSCSAAGRTHAGRPRHSR